MLLTVIYDIIQSEMIERLDLKTIFTFDELLPFMQTSSRVYDEVELVKAYRYSDSKHTGQLRISGESYISHPLTVAKYCLQLELDQVSIIAALLHDTVEDCDISIADIEKEFGIDVAFLVDGLTNIKQLTSKQLDEDIENFRKMVLKSAEDMRIVVVKLCDKVHNIYTIRAFPEEKQFKSAKKIQRLWEPLAEYMGIFQIKRAFEELIFPIINKDEYKEVELRYNEYIQEHNNNAKLVESKIRNILEDYKIENFIVESRIKALGSFFNKLKRKYGNQEIDIINLDKKISDIYAFRILLNSIEDCYIVLGLVHSRFQYIDEQFDDYIQTPKPSGYKSIHTIILDENGTKYEVQIKTHEMHEYNEFGPASHIAYKHGGKDYDWTKNVQMAIQNGDDYRARIFQDKIFVFTPKSKVIILDIESTPIDFAYQVHSEIGDRYIGAKVNSKMVDATFKLQTGDVVEILTDKNKKAPSVDLLDIARMTETKARIRKANRLITDNKIL